MVTAPSVSDRRMSRESWRGRKGLAPSSVPHARHESWTVSVNLKRPLRLMLVIIALMFSLSTFAGSLSFRLSLTGSQLTVINQGDSSAFYPAVFRMLRDGSWRQLKTSSAPAELEAGARLELTWPDLRLLEQMSEFERIQPVMVRFFDQAGVGFGQISFFRSPPAAKSVLKAKYVDGTLEIEPPDGGPSIRASWVLCPLEEGIRPIRSPVRFEHRQPPALRVDWGRQGGIPLRLDTGAGQPAAVLIHETEQGYVLQVVSGGGLQGREQRAAWLDAAPKFYVASLIAFGIGAATMVPQLLGWLRRRARTGQTKT
jgi:hypothetical protein